MDYIANIDEQTCVVYIGVYRLACPMHLLALQNCCYSLWHNINLYVLSNGLVLWEVISLYI